MRQVLLTESAAADIEGHLRYAENFGGGAREHFQQKLEKAFTTLARFPFAGVDLGHRRKFSVPGTPVVLVYRVRDQFVQITRCFDGRSNWPSEAKL